MKICISITADETDEYSPEVLSNGDDPFGVAILAIDVQAQIVCVDVGNVSPYNTKEPAGREQPFELFAVPIDKSRLASLWMVCVGGNPGLDPDFIKPYRHDSGFADCGL